MIVGGRKSTEILIRIHFFQSITTIAIYLIVLLQFKLSLIQEQSYKTSLQQSLVNAMGAHKNLTGMSLV